MKSLFTALALLVATPAAAQCVSVDLELAEIASLNLTATALEGDAVKAAERVFNALPPESNHIVATALIVELSNGDVILGVGPVGAICGRVRFDVTAWPRIRRILMGEVI